MIESIKIEGLSALADALKALPDAIAQKYLRKATSSMAAMVRNEARINAARGGSSYPHVLTGEMVRDIQMKRERGGSKLNPIYSVYVRSGKKSRLAGKGRNVDRDSFYWKFVEFGHWINTGKALGGGTGKSHKDSLRARAIASGRNKFVAARPFMRPAFESQKENCVHLCQVYLEQAIAAETAALGGRK